MHAQDRGAVETVGDLLRIGRAGKRLCATLDEKVRAVSLAAAFQIVGD